MDQVAVDDWQQQRKAWAVGGERTLPAVESAVVLSLVPLTATTSGGVETITAALGLVLQLNDTVLIARVGPSALAVAVINRGIVNTPDNPTANLPPAPPLAPPSSGSSTFAAIEARSFRNGIWRTDTGSVVQGDWTPSFGTNSGAWFYGGGPLATLAGATVIGCAIRLLRGTGGTYSPQTTHLYRHSANELPVVDVIRVDGPIDVNLDIEQELWVDLPTGWGQALVDSGGGIGTFGVSPYVILSGLDADPQSGLLRIDWTR